MKSATHLLLFVFLCMLLRARAIDGQDLTFPLHQTHASQPQMAVSSSSSSSDSLLLDASSPRCEPLNTDVLQLCKDITYNETRFPNFLKQRTQQEAAADTALYLPLIRINCSPVLKLFLCSLYAPPCVHNYAGTLRPCREMCEKAKSGCEHFMQRFAFSWPDYIDCWRFPSFNGAEACVTDDNYLTMTTTASAPFMPPIIKPAQPLQFYSHSPPAIQQPQAPTSNKIDTSFFANLTPQQLQMLLNSLTNAQPQPADQPAFKYTGLQQQQQQVMRVRFVCPPPLQLVADTRNTYYLSVDDELVANCGMPCDATLFDASEIAFARSWILLWSALCFASTCFTVLTFLMEHTRFRYPERPIIFISVCYMLVALAYVCGSSALGSNALVCRSQRNAAPASSATTAIALGQFKY